MAEITLTGVVDSPGKRICYYQPAIVQTALATPNQLIRPDPPFDSYVPVYPDLRAQFRIPKSSEKWRRCVIDVYMPPVLLIVNTVTGIAYNMRCQYLLMLANNLLFDGKTVFTSFLGEKDSFEVDPALRTIDLGTSIGKLKIDPINALPENGVNNTHIDFPLNVVNQGRGAFLFRPTVTFYK